MAVAPSINVRVPDQRDDGLYECPDCHEAYVAEASLAFCCNPAALARYGGDCD